MLKESKFVFNIRETFKLVYDNVLHINHEEDKYHIAINVINSILLYKINKLTDIQIDTIGIVYDIFTVYDWYLEDNKEFISNLIESYAEDIFHSIPFLNTKRVILNTLITQVDMTVIIAYEKISNKS